MDRPKQILPVIIFSQFAGTSLWFAGNAILGDIQQSWDLGIASLGWMTSSVQLGFISGTFLFALLSIADRFSPRLLFLICSLIGAMANLSLLVVEGSLINLVIIRFTTGFFLAGIYPVGMKIAAGWYQKGLGRALGYLVGALVLGTAFPHFVKGFGGEMHWKTVILTVSILAVSGGMMMFVFVKNGPHHTRSQQFEWNAITRIFRIKEFRSAAFGYFGHMWELYAFWTFVPFILGAYTELNNLSINVSLWSFLIIGLGTPGCIIGGMLSKRMDSSRVAFAFLLISGICCVLSLFLFSLHISFFLAILIIWGFTVVADSPQFSTLNALAAPRDLVGTGLTIVTSIGFAVSIASIELLNVLKEYLDTRWLFLFLVPGPVFGLRSLKYLLDSSNGSFSAT